jgi:hypothetical protein
MFEKLVGIDSFPSVVLVATKWAKDSSEEYRQQQQRAEEFKANYWRQMVDAGAIVAPYDNKIVSAQWILTMLKDRPQISLRKQPEREDEKLSAIKKAAGKFVLRNWIPGWWFICGIVIIIVGIRVKT